MKSLYPEQIGQFFRQRALSGTVADIEEPWNLSKDYLYEHYLQFFATEGLECVEVYGSKVSHGHKGVLSGKREEFEGICDRNDLKSWEPFYVSTDLLRDILDSSEQDLKEISKLSKGTDLDVLGVEVYASEDLVPGLRVHQVLPVREQGRVCLVLSYPLPEELFYKSVRRGLILITAQVPEGQWVDYRVEELKFSLIQVSPSVRAEVGVQPVLYEPLLDAICALVQVQICLWSRYRICWIRLSCVCAMLRRLVSLSRFRVLCLRVRRVRSLSAVLRVMFLFLVSVFVLLHILSRITVSRMMFGIFGYC